MPTFHPAFLLRSPERKRDTWDDMKLVVTILRGEQRELSPMRGLWLEDRRLRVRDDLPVPEPPPGEAGSASPSPALCHTDLELVRGYYPYAGVLGHEFVGVVDRAPSRSLVGGPPRRRRDQRDLRRLPDLPRRTIEPLRAAHRPRHRATATARSPTT